MSTIAVYGVILGLAIILGLTLSYFTTRIPKPKQVDPVEQELRDRIKHEERLFRQAEDDLNAAFERTQEEIRRLSGNA